MADFTSVSDIIDRGRKKAYSNTTLYPNADAIIDFNILYHEVENDIANYIDEDYYYDVAYADLITDQVEYTLPTSDQSTNGLKKIKNVSMKFENDSIKISSYDVGTKTVTLVSTYSDLYIGQTLTFTNKEGYVIGTDTVLSISTPNTVFILTTGISTLVANYLLRIKTNIKYYPAKEISPYNYPQDESQYRLNQPKSDPIYKIADNSLFIYPTATEDVTYGLKIYYLRDQTNLTTGDVVANIKIPRQFFKVLAYGMRRKSFEHRGMHQEAQMSKSEYDNERIDLINKLSDRNLSTVEGNLPTLTIYE